MYKANDIVIYQINDAAGGKVRIKLLKPKNKILGFTIWRVEILAIIEKAKFGGNPKIGSKGDISERWFIHEVTK